MPWRFTSVLDNKPLRADNPKSGHDVPKAGTLDEISYCRKCGMGFDYEGPCKPDGINRDSAYWIARGKR